MASMVIVMELAVCMEAAWAQEPLASAKDADAILDMFNKNSSKYHREGTEDMKAYKIGRVAYAEGEVKTQKDSLIFEDYS